MLPDDRAASGYNVITLCFCMHCSYKPPMMAIAIQDINESYKLAQSSSEFVLAVPGESMADVALACGWESIRDVDKIKALSIELIASNSVAVASLADAIANVELKKVSETRSGDHLIVVGEVLRYRVNTSKSTQPLLSVGRDTTGFRVLARRGIHTLAVVETASKS